MCTRYRLAQFLKQRLQVLFRRLLAQIADLITEYLAPAAELDGGPIIGVGLAHPLRR
jgi:hypothetical protein